jgi:peptidyl-prolyl cis-trans isomerase B (cyclophilin B)
MIITLLTNLGSIVIELDHENTVETTNNFLKYAKSGFYDGTIIHRVVKDFVIQGGGFKPGMVQKMTNEPILNEANKAVKNTRGTVAMARTSDPHSATSQFFINLADNDFLNFTSESREGWGYCVFGQVVEGMAIVDEIAAVPSTAVAGHQDVPVEDVIVEKVIIHENSPSK